MNSILKIEVSISAAAVDGIEYAIKLVEEVKNNHPSLFEQIEVVVTI